MFTSLFRVQIKDQKVPNKINKFLSLRKKKRLFICSSNKIVFGFCFENRNHNTN